MRMMPSSVPVTTSYTARHSHVRFGSKADMGSAPGDVRFTPESGHADLRVKVPTSHSKADQSLR